MMIMRILLNESSGIFIAILAPSSDPITAGIDNNTLIFHTPFITSFNLINADIFCIIIEIRFVPLAVTGESPININIGIVSKDPPADTILIKPINIPNRNKQININMVINLSGYSF